MSSFNEIIQGPLRENLGKNKDKFQGIPIPFERFSKFSNFIRKGQNITVGGLQNTGKAYFTDYVFFINVYKWWLKLDENSRPPLKVLYFNMKTPFKIKLKRWLCLNSALGPDGIIIDIPTLQGDVGKLYDIDEEVYNKISNQKEFFDTLESEVLTVIEGEQTPSSIYNRTKNFMSKFGDYSEEESRFIYKPEFSGQMTFVIIDNSDYLLPESESGQMLNHEGVKRKMASYLKEIRDKFNTTNIINVSIKNNFMKSVKDSQPNYKQLGPFSEVSDLGLIIYNPYEENNLKYLNFPVQDLVINGKNRFRTLSLVRNSTGISNVTVGLIFLGECGRFSEAPRALDEAAWEEKIGILNNLI
jgi:hypothetical protein